MTLNSTSVNLDRDMTSHRRQKFDFYPWLIGLAALVALSAGFWSILSPSTDIWSGLVFICGLTILMFVGVFVLSTSVNESKSESFLSAHTGFGSSNEFMLLVGVLDMTPDAYMVQTRSGAIVYANHAYNDLTKAGNRGRNLGRPLPLDQVFTGDQKLAAPLYRLARAARLGKNASEALEVVTAEGPKTYTVYVSQVPNHPNYVTWRVALGGADEPVVVGEGPSEQVHRDDIIEDEPEHAYEFEMLQLPNRRERPIMRPSHSKVQAFEVISGRSHDEDRPIEIGGISLDFTDLLENAPVAIAILTSEGLIRYGNTAFRILIENGLEKDQPLADYVVADEQENVLQAVKDVAEGRALSVPLEVPLSGSGKRLTQLFANRIDLEDGSGTSGAIAYLIDVTEHRSMEVQFAQSQKLQAVGQLAGGVAHDFNNLLTAIIGFCDLLLARHGVGDPSFADIDQIRQNANRAANLVRQLLAFSRQQTLRPKLFEPFDLLTDLTILLQRLLGEKVELDVVHGRNLGMIMVDQAQFDTALINLAVNARDAMPDGGRLSIRSSAFEQSESRDKAPDLIKPGHYVMIEVSDTGTGIAPEVLEKVFEPFFTTKAVGEGTGLGLSTVYGIIKQMDGYIFPESKIGEGTTFKIYLPYQEKIEVTKEAREDEKSDTRDLTGAETILLVEDEDAVRAFASRALESRGYTVLQAENGAIAYELLQEDGEEIDLIISDVVMPEMDGPALAQKVQAEYPDIKMIFISGYAEDAFKKSIERPDDVTFLPKPFTLKQLAAAVKEAL